jgi:tetratricopeptide (TPR) repeat protein
LGQLAAFAKQSAEAEKALRKARDLKDDVPETWIALILFLARDNPLQAEAELVAAQAKLPPNKGPQALGVCYEAIGKLDKAEEQFLAAAELKPVDPSALARLAAFFGRTRQAAKEQTSLTKLLEPAVKAPKEIEIWARRVLALNLSMQGGTKSLKKASALLDKNEGEPATTPEDKVADKIVRAMVLATQPDKRADAIKLCEEFTEQELSRYPGALFFLAEVYEATGDWSKAKTKFALLEESYDKNPVVLGRFAQGLLRHKEVDAAGVLVDRLAKVAPGAWETVELQARVLQKQDKTDKARKIVLAYAERPKARLDLAAGLLENLGQAADAELLYRSHMDSSKSPDAPLQLAQHLARQGRTAEALALCEKAWNAGSPEVVAFATMGVLRAGKATPQQQEMVEGWLVKAIAKSPENLAFLTVLADLEDFRGKPNDAKDVYRRILKKNGENIFALNNLAYLQALQREKLDECLNMINKAIDIAGQHPSLLDTRAMVLMQQEKYQPAIEDLGQAIVLQGSATNYYHRARAQLLSQNLVAARDDMKTARDKGIQAEQLSMLERLEFEKVSKQLQ